MSTAQAPRRRRYPAEEARRRILEAARLRLADVGPEGLRLQEIAADLGISHPAILHHFGSREGLLRELAVHASQALNAEIAGRIGEGTVDLRDILALTQESLGNQGQARLLAWLALSGRVEPAGPQTLRALVRVAHARRQEGAGAAGGSAPDEADTGHLVLLLALTLFADALLGDALRASGGMSGREAFQAWLAELVEAHLDRNSP